MFLQISCTVHYDTLFSECIHSSSIYPFPHAHKTQINGEIVAGYSADKASKCIKKAGANDIKLAVRDRPFERTVTMQKDSSNHVGFSYNNGEIKAIVKDSSAARCVCVCVCVCVSVSVCVCVCVCVCVQAAFSVFS